MNNSMNILRRLMAFLLALLLVTTMVGDDFYTRAEGEVVESTEESGGEESAAAPEESVGGEYTAPEGEASVNEAAPVDETGTGEITGEPGIDGDITGQDNTGIDNPVIVDENGNIITPENGNEASNQDGANNDANNPNPIDTPSDETNNSITENNGSSNDQITEEETETHKVEEEEESDEELEEEELEEEDEKDKECKHEWKYISNGDGTHEKICALCGDSVTQDCSMEDGACIHCGYTEEKEDEYEYEYEYTSNDDGTHIKRTIKRNKKTGEEEISDETEECEFDAEGICIHCGFKMEDMGYKLVYTKISKTIDGVEITVKGEMPENATVEIQPISLDYAEQILDNAGKENNEVFRAYDITIYDADGNKYQPQTDGGAVEITVSGIGELNDVDDSAVEVHRVEEGNGVTKLDSSVSGSDVTFESEHFSYIIISAEETLPEDSFTVKGGSKLATSAQATKYTRVTSAYIYIELEEEEDAPTLTATFYDSNSSTNDKPGVGNAIATATCAGITASNPGWYKAEFNFTYTAGTDSYVNPGDYYSIVISGFVGRNYEVKMGLSSHNTYTMTGNNALLEPGALGTIGLSLEEIDAPDDVTGITITSQNKTLDGDKIYYSVGETDKLIATLTPNYARSIKWTIDSGSCISLGSDGSITANSAGTAVVQAKYSDTVFAKVTITVFAISLSDTTSGSYTTNYSVEYNAQPQKPHVKLSDGTTNYGEDQLGSISYSSNKDAGTATVNIPYTSSGGVTYTFAKDFTITPKLLTWDANFASANFVIDTSKNTVSSVTGATSGLTDVPLTLGTDYTVALSDKTTGTAGISYKVTITGKGNYKTEDGSNYGTYVVDTSADDISKYLEVHWVNDEEPSFEYTGKAITTPTDDWANYFIFYEAGTKKVASWVAPKTSTSGNTTATYTDNENVGDATISFAVDGYKGTLTLNFNIYELSISNNSSVVATLAKSEYTRTGEEIRPAEDLTVTFKVDESTTKTLVKDTDYELTYANNTAAGIATITIKGIGNFTGQQTKSFTITPNFTDDAVIWVNQNGNYKASSSTGWKSGYTRVYTGSVIQPTAHLYLGGTRLTQTQVNSTADGYYVQWADSVTSDKHKASELTANAGTKYLVCVGTGKYDGFCAAAEYTVSKVNIGTNTDISFNLNTTSFTYTADPVELKRTDYTLSFNGTDLVEGADKDFTIVYNNNHTDVTNSASFTIKASENNYTGSLSGTFAITPATIKDSNITLEYTSIAYTGAENKPGVTLTLDNGNFVSDSNYTLSYADNIAAGTATVTVTGVNNLTGAVPKTFTITSRSAANLTIKLNGYQVTDSEFSPASGSSDLYKYCSSYKPKYTGKKLRPSVEVFDGATQLSYDDFTYTYVNNENVVEYNSSNVSTLKSSYVKISGQGNYYGTGDIYVFFEIQPRDISASTIDITVAAPDWSASHTGTYSPVITIVDNGSDLISSKRGKALDPATAYTVTADSTATKAGSGYTATITGKGNYTGTVEETYGVGHDISNPTTVVLKNPYDATENYSLSEGYYQVDYIGSDKTPYEVLTVDGATLSSSETSPSNYQYLVESRTSDAGYDLYNSHGDQNIITVVLKGNEDKGYYGTYTYKYRIKRIDLSVNGSTPSNSHVSITCENNPATRKFTGEEINVAHTTAGDGELTITYKVGSFSEELKYGADNDYTMTPETIGPAKGVTSVSVAATAESNYKNGFNYTYTIGDGELKKIDIAEGGQVYKDDSGVYWVYYTGSAINIDTNLTVYNSGDKPLTQGRDYTLSYDTSGLVNGIGTITITATGAGNYATTSTATATFEVRAIDVGGDDFKIIVGSPYYEFTGSQIKPADITVYYGTTLLREDTDYTLSYGTNTVPGKNLSENYVQVTGKGKYQGTKKANINIYLMLRNMSISQEGSKLVAKNGLVKVELDNTTFTAGETPTAYVYYSTGTDTWSSAIEASYTVGSATEYNYTVTGSQRPGKGSVTVTGQSSGAKNFVSGNITFDNVPFKTPISSDVANARLLQSDFAYTGGDVNVDAYIALAYGEKDVDYTVTYPTDIKSVGAKKITLTAKPDSAYYTGSVQLTYNIKYDLNDAEISLSGTGITYGADGVYRAAYTGSDISFSVTVVCGGKTVPSASLAIDPSSKTVKNVGTHTITISKGETATDVMGDPQTIELEVSGIDITDYYRAFKQSNGSYADTYTAEFTGNDIKPTVLIKPEADSATTLVRNVDYTLEYHNCINATQTERSTYVTVTGMGAYSGTFNMYYTITPVDLSKCTISVEQAVYAGPGVPVKPAVRITYGTLTLKRGTDYQINDETAYKNNDIGATDYLEAEATRIGQPFTAYPSVTITPGTNGNYSIAGGALNKDFRINKLDLRSTTVTIGKTSAEYTGDPVPLDSSMLSLEVNGTILEYNSDYELTILNSNNAPVSEIVDKGDYTITITGIRSCDQSITKRFTVTDRSIPANYLNGTGKISITVGDVSTIGGTPTVVIKDAGVAGASAENPVTLNDGSDPTKPTDYTITVVGNDKSGEGGWDTSKTQDSYGNYDVKEGSPYVIITGTGNYSGEQFKVPFSVGKSLPDLAAEGKFSYHKDGTYIQEFTYDGVSHLPKLTEVYVVEDDGSHTTLTEGTDFEIQVVNESGDVDTVNAGVKTVNIIGKGRYYGTVTDSYKINTRILEGEVTWKNSYTRDTSGVNIDKVTLKLEGPDLTTLTAAKSSEIFGDASFAGYYYQEYDGKPITPTITITDGGLASGSTAQVLRENVDYTVRYDDNNKYYDPTVPDAKMACVTVTFPTDSGNYAGSTTTIKAYFIIGQSSIGDGKFKVQFEREDELQLLDYAFDYTGTYITPAVVVSNTSDAKLKEGTDYRVYYTTELLEDTSTESLIEANKKQPRDPGKGYVYVEGIGSYKGVLYREYKIMANMDQCTFVGYKPDGVTIDTSVEGIPDQFLTGQEIDPIFAVILYRSDGTYMTLTKNTDYTVVVSSDDNYTTTGKVTITAKNPYFRGEKVGNFNIALDKSLIKIINFNEEYMYTGRAIKPDFETNYPNILVDDSLTEYFRRTYNPNGSYTDVPVTSDDDLKNVGTIAATVHWFVESDPTQTGEQTVEYKIIERPIDDCKVVLAKTQRYTGKAQTPSFTIFLKVEDIDGKARVYTLKDSDYTVTYGGEISGTGTITIKGTGNFSGTRLDNFEIALWPIVNLHVTAYTQDSISVAWARDMYSEGTELDIENLGTGATQTVRVEGKATSYTFKNLTGSTKYRISARAYVGTGIFSSKDVSIEQATEISTAAFRVASNSAGSMTITCTNSASVTMYYIYRDDNTTSKADDTLIAVIPKSSGAETSYTNSGLTSGKTYYYYVQGYYLDSNKDLELVSESDYVSAKAK